MPDPHHIALLALTGGTAVAALLMADAADEARHNFVRQDRGRLAKLSPAHRMMTRALPMAMRGVSLGFLCGMATSGAFLVNAFP